MFSGKSEELIRRVTRSKIARIPVQVFKPQLDDRYAVGEVVSHSAWKVDAEPVSDSIELVRAVDAQTQVIGIDEGQFFDDGLVEVVDNLASTGKQVIIAGLDTDYLRRPFEPIPSLCDRAEYVTKMLAVCHRCGGARHVHPTNRAERRPGGSRCSRRLRVALSNVLRPDRARATFSRTLLKSISGNGAGSGSLSIVRRVSAPSSA